MSLPAEAQEAARAALGKMDEVLAARPAKDDYVLSDATQALTTLRDALIAQGLQADAARDRLERLNAVLGVVLGVHFPIGETPWAQLETARGWYLALLAELGVAAEAAPAPTA